MLGRDCLAVGRQLELDLDNLMRDMRACEDNFLTLTTHIHRLMHPTETSLFVNEHIVQYRAVIHKVKTENMEAELAYAAIIQRYASNEAESDQCSVLLKRVTYRLLEIFFTSISTINNKIPQILQDYLRLKLNCQKLLQEDTSNQPCLLMKAITDYEFRKLRKYLDLLTELTNHLENGDLDNFSKL
jgi:hypothetical protein